MTRRSLRNDTEMQENITRHINSYNYLVSNDKEFEISTTIYHFFTCLVAANYINEQFYQRHEEEFKLKALTDYLNDISTTTFNKGKVAENLENMFRTPKPFIKYSNAFVGKVRQLLENMTGIEVNIPNHGWPLRNFGDYSDEDTNTSSRPHTGHMSAQIVEVIESLHNRMSQLEQKYAKHQK